MHSMWQDDVGRVWQAQEADRSTGGWASCCVFPFPCSNAAMTHRRVTRCPSAGRHRLTSCRPYACPCCGSGRAVRALPVRQEHVAVVEPRHTVRRLHRILDSEPPAGPRSPQTSRKRRHAASQAARGCARCVVRAFQVRNAHCSPRVLARPIAATRDSSATDAPCAHEPTPIRLGGQRRRVVENTQHRRYQRSRSRFAWWVRVKPVIWGVGGRGGWGRAPLAAAGCR